MRKKSFLSCAFMHPSIWYNDGMAQFARKSIVSINQFSIGHNTTAYTSTQRYHDKIFHTFCGTIHHFTNCCGVGIVG